MRFKVIAVPCEHGGWWYSVEDTAPGTLMGVIAFFYDEDDACTYARWRNDVA